MGRARQSDIADLLEIGQSDFSKRLSGKVAWKGEELQKVADAFDMSLTELCTLDYGCDGSGGPWQAPVIDIRTKVAS